MHIGNFIYKFRWAIIIVWVLALVGMFATISTKSAIDNERASFLPEDSEFPVASREIVKSFPQQYGLSTAVIIFERKTGKLTPQDIEYIDKLGALIKTPAKGEKPPKDLDKITVSYPGKIDAQFQSYQSAKDAIHNAGNFLGNLVGFKRKNTPPAEKVHIPNPMRSKITAAGQASIIRINIPTASITLRATQIISHVRNLIAQNPSPEGLNVAVTGSAGFGYDYARFVKKSQKGTMWATMIAVVVILLLVYKSPISAFLPLLGITVAAGVVVKFINVFQNMGCSIGTAEKMFVFVLMYGAGIDYSLLLISRYREFLSVGRSHADACKDAIKATSPAIAASAATDSIGILMLAFTQYLIFQTTGPVVAFSLVIAMLASLTLVPALIAITGGKMFWPVKLKTVSNQAKPSLINRIFNPWPAVAKLVTKRPGATLAIALIVLAFPVSKAFNVTFTYDTLSNIPAEYLDKNAETAKASSIGAVGNAAAGTAMVKRHWPIGEISPVEVLIKSEKPISPANMRKLSTILTKHIEASKIPQNLRIMTQPLGKPDPALKDKISESSVVSKFAGNLYLGDRVYNSKGNVTGYHSLRAAIVQNYYAMSNQALKEIPVIRKICREAIDDFNKTAPPEEKINAQVYLTGSSVETAATRDITQGDFKRLLILVLGSIFIIVLILLRDFWLTAFMVFGICVSYLTTLGLCVMIFGDGSLDWKVQVFLFVVVAAVGVDYNIFLAARLAQEAKHHQPAEAVRQAVIFTGPVISSCGIIMAATLGSLMVGEIGLLRQLGVALGLGMLIDTFVVRPFLLPAFATKFKRTGKANKLLV